MSNLFKDRSVLKTAFEATGGFLACLAGEPAQMGIVSAGNLYEVAKQKCTGEKAQNDGGQKQAL